MPQTAGVSASSDPVTGAVHLPVPRSGGLVLATWTLWHREMIRFFRQRNRVASAFITPILFWIMLGFGLDRSFTAPLSPDSAAHPATEIGYLEYFFPGTVVMILLFTAIFSTISVIEDRREGFLQGVLVAPIPRLSIVLGKVLGGASVAMFQAIIFTACWPLVAPWPDLGWMLLAVGIMLILSVGLTTLGLCLAWPMDSAAGFHAVMMLLLMPMWFLSGAVFPLTSAPRVMQVIMWLNPLTYGQAALAAALAGSRQSGAAMLVLPATLITLALTVVALLVACRMVMQPAK